MSNLAPPNKPTNSNNDQTEKPSKTKYSKKIKTSSTVLFISAMLLGMIITPLMISIISTGIMLLLGVRNSMAPAIMGATAFIGTPLFIGKNWNMKEEITIKLFMWLKKLGKYSAALIWAIGRLFIRPFTKGCLKKVIDDSINDFKLRLESNRKK